MFKNGVEGQEVGRGVMPTEMGLLIMDTAV